MERYIYLVSNAKYYLVAHYRKIGRVANLLQIYNKKTIYKHKYQ
jgi:hypothetical protein